MILQCDVNTFEGVITISKTPYYIHIYMPQYPSLKDSIVHVSFNLKIIIDNLTVSIQKFIESCDSLECLEKRLQEIITQSTKPKATGVIHSRKFYETLLPELNEIKPSPTISANFQEIIIRRTDAGSREHTAVILIPQKYPDEPIQIKQHELPLVSGQNCAPNLHDVTSLSQFYRRFCEIINHFQPFWDSLGILDTSCWVLEPQQPKLSDNFRRIQVLDCCCVLLTFDPYQPFQRPTIEFRGMQDKVDRLRCSLEKNLINGLWDPDADVHLNLLTVLDLEGLPSKPIEVENMYTLVKPGECGICFEERLDDELACFRCDNAKCDSQFHQTCLLTYLSGNLSNVRMKNSVFGRCPVCRDPIGCPINFNSINSI